MKKNILVYVSIFLFGISIHAQSSIIKGKVIDVKTNEPIQFATIENLGNQENSITNVKGEFSIIGEVDDEIKVSHLSYKPIIVKLQNDIIVQLTLSHIDLNEIIVIGSPLDDISQSTVINDTEKRISQPRSVGHLFNDIKGFGIVKRGAYASEPVFRSFKYEQLNIQYDGGMKVLNACPNRMDPITTHVIPEEIEKIEIVKGPFTVRFGQNFGGIINLVSKNPTKDQLGFHGSIEGGFETNGGNIVNGASLVYVDEKYDVTLNGSYRDFGDYKDGKGDEVPSSFKTTDYSVKVGINPTEKQRLQLTWRQSFARDIDHAGLPMDSPYDDSSLAGIDYKLTNISDKIQSFSTKVFYSEVDHLMTNENRPNFMMVDAQSPVSSSIYGGKLELVLTPSDKSKVYIGGDANIIGREGDRTRIVKMMNGNMLSNPMTMVDKIWQDASLNDIGVFVEGKFKVADFTTLTTGLRTDFISTSIDDPAADFEALYGGVIEEKTETNISVTTSLKYKKNGLQTQLAIGRGVRTASMLERYINHFSVGVDPFEYVGNPNLKPEINNQIELSFIKKFKTFELGASVFHSFLEDYIFAQVNTDIPRKFMPTTPPVFAKQFINLDKASQTGFEFNFNINTTDKLSISTDVSYTRGQNKDFDEPLSQIPPFKANIGAKFEEDRYWISLNTRIVGKQDRISTTYMEQETPSYGTIDLRVGFEPIDKLSIGVAALNLLDTSYYEHLNFSFKNSNTLSGRIYEPGRNFTTYIKYKF
ncbi:TonB-dependent receptor domain-containing protein [Urechidicola croceus]|uniref:TonB-dependent receptor n=1 Tax=Urechidicola croceus TaxID=1850246 RepID=A0A1D8P6P2_9FLAO|nr:TonB-dependent receptor [Urechidicola croceus]AOW20241.1 hypothetical protein LPB138_05920 [Urechidicola croceus]